MKTTHAVAALALAATIGLGACGSDSKARSAPEAATKATTTTTEAPTTTTEAPTTTTTTTEPELTLRRWGVENIDVVTTATDQMGPMGEAMSSGNVTETCSLAAKNQPAVQAVLDADPPSDNFRLAFEHQLKALELLEESCIDMDADLVTEARVHIETAGEYMEAANEELESE